MRGEQERRKGREGSGEERERESRHRVGSGGREVIGRRHRYCEERLRGGKKDGRKE